MSNNLLGGPLDGHLKIDQLPLLERFTLGNNGLEGPIPDTLGNATSLRMFYMDINRLTGPIPPSLGNLTGLQQLDLSGNNLEGSIPVSLLKPGLPLGFFHLTQNELDGSIPAEIGQPVQMIDLNLADNRFSGILPDSLGNCSKMATLDLSGNQLQGDIPGAAIARMFASLTTLNLSSNLFSGPWPREFAKLVAVAVINVSANNLSGPIPLGLGQCSSLNSLDVSWNNLTGVIPEDLGSLKHLQFFNASFNYFTGPIPQTGAFSNSSQINGSSFLGNPGLCGSVSSIGLGHEGACPAAPLNVSGHERHCKGFDCKHVRIPVAVVSSLIVLGAVGITVAIRLGWILRGGRGTDDHPQMQLLLNFGGKVRFTEKDVLQTINDASGGNVIGKGGRSIVYKGILPGGQVLALKKLLPRSAFQGEKDDAGQLASSEYREVVKEATILSQLRHNNILKYLSFYSDADHKALMLEYMSEGCLHKQLHEVQPCQLRWQTRLRIALGVAQGMKYLHHDLPEPLIHRDLKPSNIFLDADYEPKVADFGISKFVGASSDGEATASTFCGTVGYMPPEYGSQVRVSTKGDEYGYGMLIIELLTGRQPCSGDALDDQGTDLRNWVLDRFHERPFELLDPSLVEECTQDNVAKEQVLCLLRVSLFCTKADPQSRPSMINVVGMLVYICDRGVEPTNRRTIEELANDIDPLMWMSEAPSGEGAEFG